MINRNMQIKYMMKKIIALSIIHFFILSLPAALRNPVKNLRSE